MNDDELIARLRGIDPAAAAPIDPVDGPRAAAFLEQIMNTPFNDPINPGHTPSPAPRRARHTWLWAGAGALVVAAAAVVGVLATGDDDQPVATSASYSLAAGDPMAMCMRVDEYQPTPDVGGFRGTVTAIEPGSVTLSVSTWYRGGDADQVVLTLADMPSPALDGVEFTQGGDYLVGVLDGQVLICGISAPYSPELEALYDQWFAG